MFFASVDIKWHQDSRYQQKFEKREFMGEGNVKKHLPDAISEAQKFIVDKCGKEVAFDIVEIQYSSPSSLDLTVVDLPGFVRSVGRGESESIKDQTIVKHNA